MTRLGNILGALVLLALLGAWAYDRWEQRPGRRQRIRDDAD
jgi:hypothetical protein